MDIEHTDPPAAALPFAYGGPPLAGVLRAQPEDFVVVERLGFAPTGAGEHVFLSIEKRGVNTEWLARQLARFAGVQPVAIGYAGLKDRHAVTRQHFTVHLPGKAERDWSSLGLEGVTVLQVTRHARKLPRGALQGNDFVLTLRGISGDHAAALDLIDSIARRGVPNAFGAQRFGRDGGNLEQARAMFAGGRVERSQRSILLSAARSELFNRVLAARVTAATWDQLLSGDVAQLDGTGSIFGPVEPTPELLTRIAAMDIHPTGPLWGAGELRSSAAVQAQEQSVADAEPAIVDGLCRAGMRQERRALRVRVADFSAQFIAADVLQLRFGLPAGAYATGVVRELLASNEAPATSVD